MRGNILFKAMLTFVIANFISGCAGSPVEPDNTHTLPVTKIPGSSPTGHQLWGYWIIHSENPDKPLEVIPARQALMHLNIINFLESSSCSDCLKFAFAGDGPDGSKNIDVTIKHPPYLNKTNFTGFDVRGITILNGSKYFAESGLTMSLSELGDGELINADGYTTLHNPETLGNGIEGYIKGKFASSELPNATLNGYKRHVTEEADNIRNAFYAGKISTVTYQIKFPSGPFTFGYAIDASWAPPIKKPVEDPMKDFGPEANCAEAWKISVQQVEISAGLTEIGGRSELIIDVFDWQGADTISTVKVECPELYDGNVAAQFVENYSDHSEWQIIITNPKFADPGTYQCLIKVEDTENTDSKPWLDLTAYQILKVNISSVDTKSETEPNRLLINTVIRDFSLTFGSISN
jgi:hypothetical protein